MKDEDWVYLWGSREVPPGAVVVYIKSYEDVRGLKVDGHMVVRMHNFSSIGNCDFRGKARFESRKSPRGVRIIGCNVSEAE